MGLDFIGDFRAVFDFLARIGVKSSSSELESVDALAFERSFEEISEDYEAGIISGFRSTSKNLCIRILLSPPFSPFFL